VTAAGTPAPTIAPLWRCPRCRGPLTDRSTSLACPACNASYPCFEGIPDLRLPGASWIDHEADRAEARRLIETTAGLAPEQVARYVYGLHTECSAEWADLRTRQLVDGRPRLAREIRGWLNQCVPPDGIFLDLGCGTGQLLATAAVEKRQGVGIDVRLVWLLVAKRLIEAAGGTPHLAAAMAEALPLADGSLQGVVSLDVIEHVGDVPAYLREIDRVLAPGGHAAFATPNRYSLTAEPHVFVWGVGWLPRRWQRAFVKWRSGKSYDFVRLLSVRETRALFRRHTDIEPRIIVPQVAAEELAHFPPLRRTIARTYNRLAGSAVLAPLFHAIGPFFRVVGRKRAPGGGGAARAG
jgi:SAM-dependent methyltransferase/uncharacterized protein YbaR (Trm112 family)